jgi:diadenosine tetraphosphate (Ap4A) HIT family hydrolase
MTAAECRSCLSNSGERRISPGPPIHVSDFWQVEHAYPTKLRGWLVVVLRRHVEALHELTPAEFRDLSGVLERTVRVLYEVVSCEKEYVACFAELEHFKHVHFHVIPRASDLPANLIGTRSFDLLKVSEADSVTRAETLSLCEALNAAFVGNLR